MKGSTTKAGAIDRHSIATEGTKRPLCPIVNSREEACPWKKQRRLEDFSFVRPSLKRPFSLLTPVRTLDSKTL